MGVTNLWQILEPVKQHVHLKSLKGKTLAVDLSLWVCEAQTVKKMIGVVMKPHLRNLYFRVSSLTLMGINLIFVMEGDPPKLKASTMHKRTETRFGPTKKTARTGRSHFKFLLKEDPHVDCYSISAIEEKLGCCRESLIGLAVLLGCDYLPKGVPGVGKEQALKLIRTLRGQSLLQRFELWLEHGGNPVIAVEKVIHCAICHHPGSHKDHERVGCQLCGSVGYCEFHNAEYCCPCDWHSSQPAQQVDQVEDGIRKKAKACEGFPFPEVIQEYLISKDKQLKLNESQRPNLLSFQRFACEKMDWTKHYACQKLCALLTYYDMNRRKSGHVDPQQLQALRVVKTRMKNGTPCFEIEWEKPEHFATADGELTEPFFITIEESSLFQAAYPEIVAQYQMEKLDICKEKRRGKKNKLRECPVEDNEVADLLSRLKLQSTHETFPDHESKLNFATASNHQMLPENGCMSQGPTVTGNFSATIVKNQNPPFASLISPPQNIGNEYNSGSSLGSKVDFTNKSVDPYASAIADLQLSGIDWEGTSFTRPPTHADGVCSESESGTCPSIRQHSPLHYTTAEIITPYSDSVKYDQASPTSMACFFSNSNSSEGENNLILKDSACRALSKYPNASLVNSLQAVKQTKRMASPRVKFSSSSTWDIEKYPEGFRLQNSQEMVENLEIPGQVTQKPIDLGKAAPKGLCGETAIPTCSTNLLLRLPLKPTEALDNCKVIYNYQTIFKGPLKKSVCQNGDSSEDSDVENMKKTKSGRGSKWQRKYNLKDKSNDKWSNSESTVQTKLRGKESDFKVISTNISVKQHLKPSSIVHVHNSPSPRESVLSVSNSQLQENESDSEVWLRSPLPLSERLKLRLKSH